MGAPHVVVGHNDSDRRLTGRTGRLTGSLLLLEKSKRGSRVPGPLPTFGVDRMTVSWLGDGRSFRFLGALMNDRSANNDVLLGILAVEMKFISRDQLVRGAKVWNENPNRNYHRLDGNLFFSFIIVRESFAKKRIRKYVLGF